jgi:hypothetical protein
MIKEIDDVTLFSSLMFEVLEELMELMVLTILTATSLVNVGYCIKNRNDYISLTLSEENIGNHDVIDCVLMLLFLNLPPFFLW